MTDLAMSRRRVMAFQIVLFVLSTSVGDEVAEENPGVARALIKAVFLIPLGARNGQIQETSSLRSNQAPPNRLL